jgi:hypothetical protein
MAIIKPTVSGAISQAFLKGVADFTTLGELGPATAWHVFTVGLGDIAGNAGIQNAKPAGWRFLASGASGRVIAGEVPEASPDGTFSMTSLAHGPNVAASLQSAAQLDALDKAQAADYDLLTLRIPGLLVEAFWLKSRSGGADLVVPYVTRNKQLELNRAYSLEEFLGIVRPLAAKRLTFDDSQTGAGS